MADILSKAELKGLKSHKYSCAGTTLLDPYMQIFWRWLVEHIPLWIAPNALTLGGLLMNIFTTLVLMLYSPDGKQDAPSWAFVATATGLFIYQSLDAIDGKQARRTNNASPLGELFDHGCDAISCVMVILGFGLALQLGYEPDLFHLLMSISMFMFYSAHWRTYCTGTLQFGLIDVTEAQFGIMGVYLIAAAAGPSVYRLEIPGVGVQLKYIPYMILLISAFFTAVDYFTVIFIQGGVGKHGSTVAGTSVLGPAVPIGLVIASSYYTAWYSEAHIMQRHPVLFHLAFGMVFSKITCKLVVAHMAHGEMELLDSSYIAPLLLVLNQNFSFPLQEYFLLWVCFIYASVDLWLYAARVCSQICSYLDIYCFKITPQAPPPASTDQSAVSGATGGRGADNVTAAQNVVTSDTKPVTRYRSRVS